MENRRKQSAHFFFFLGGGGAGTWYSFRAYEPNELVKEGLFYGQIRRVVQYV